MKNFLRDYFTFNKREKRGVIILVALISLLLIWLTISKYIFSPGSVDLTGFRDEITAFEKQQEQAPGDSMREENYSENEYKVPTSLTNPVPERFSFDPNGLPEADWKRLGLSDKQIRVIKNYESKGGKFRKKEDVKKMYCITPELYASLEPFIVIAKDTNDTRPPFHRDSTWKKKEKVIVELNTADSVQLVGLKGIGPSFAKRILKYRDLLGGFTGIAQLLEVYGFDQEKFDLVKNDIRTDTMLVHKLGVNSATFDELKKHPYIKFSLAQLIVNYRKQHGPYRSLADLRKLDLVNDEVYRKIVPYLNTN
jgi:DNA uptake protein ComE-like DNA-binding protein